MRNGESSNVHGSRSRPRVRGVHGGILVVAVSIAAALAGCADSGTEPTPETAPTRSSDSSATPTPTEEPQPPRGPNPANYDFGITAGEIQPFIAESQEVFLQRPIEERALVALYYGKDVVEFAEDYYGVSGNPLDNPANLPETLSVDNAPEEVLAYIGAMNRIPFTLENPTSLELDIDASKRMIGSILGLGTFSESYPELIQFAEQLSKRGGLPPSARTLAAEQILRAQRFIEASEPTTNPNGLPKIDITIQSASNGETRVIEVVWVETPRGGTWVYNS